MKGSCSSDFLLTVTTSLDSRLVGNISPLSPRRRALLGQSLEYLCQISVCQPHCRGGDHVIESLAGRCFNLSMGSVRLISDYLYDESLNLTRSIAEITNLAFLFNESPMQLQTWRTAKRSDRLREFSPASVRKSLDQLGVPVPVTEASYRELCEKATHVTPDIRPNQHDSADEKRGYVGGHFQIGGHMESLDTLLLYCALSAVVLSNIVGRPENVEVLAELGRNTFDA